MNLKSSISFVAVLVSAMNSPTAIAASYEKAATEVSAYIQENFRIKDKDLYSIAIGKTEPDHLGGAGVMFSSLAGASRYDPGSKEMMWKNFIALDAYWDSKEFHFWFCGRGISS